MKYCSADKWWNNSKNIQLNSQNIELEITIRKNSIFLKRKIYLHSAKCTVL